MILRPVSQGSYGAPSSQLLLGWGAGLLGATTTPRYLYPWYSDRMAEVYESSLVVPRQGVLKNFRVLHGIPAGNGNQIVYTIRVAGGSTALVVNLASTGGFGENTSVLIPVNAGDYVSVMVTKALGIGESPRNISTSVDLV